MIAHVLKNSSSEDNSAPVFSKSELLIEINQCCKEKNINVNRCRSALAKLINMILRGDAFTPEELDDSFIVISRLFQVSDASLKRMLFLAMEFLHGVPNFCMATNSINKEAQQPPEALKAAAIRLLPLIADQLAPAQLERQLRLALTQTHPKVINAALFAFCELQPRAAESLRKCSDELTLLLTGNKEYGIAAQALLLLAGLRKADLGALA